MVVVVVVPVVVVVVPVVVTSRWRLWACIVGWPARRTRLGSLRCVVLMSMRECGGRLSIVDCRLSIVVVESFSLSPL